MKNLVCFSSSFLNEENYELRVCTLNKHHPVCLIKLRPPSSSIIEYNSVKQSRMVLMLASSIHIHKKIFFILVHSMHV